ncbi:hypothetical protein [Cylindrospermum sp. FACHB-282]|uniref:hypothetical protein n=1 Tax=Cylindrospermum sp. FACHB-282 TaxID=2692794 RepID=UPI00168A0F36|nr:hypothetical protein [Cylindrospermum sp. FACHB-282]MBD2386825.1 hypothetical protein [Cylindrospermum sp. FACHB-282]
MKYKDLHIRLSERQLNKLRAYTVHKEKAITSLIEGWIDKRPNTEIHKNDPNPIPS